MSAVRWVRVLALLVLLGTAAVASSGCSGSGAAQKSAQQDPALLTARRWAVKTYVAADGKMVPPIETRREIGISFEKDRASGFAGVNTFTGPYVAEANGTIKIGPLATTMMAATGPAMDMEDAYLKALGAATGYRVSATALELLDAKGATLVTYGEAAPEPELEGTQWYCTGYNNGREAFVSMVLDTQVTALFENGKLTGSSGVNDYSGTYTVEGDSLQIEAPFATTKKAGTPEAMDQESAYLQALAGVKRFGIEDRVLTLYGEGDLRLVTYSDKPFE